MRHVTISAEVDLGEVLSEASTEALEQALAERNNDKTIKALTDELHIAMSTADGEKQDRVCRTLLWELSGRIV